MAKPKILFADKTHEKALEEARGFADVTVDFEVTPEKLLEEIPKYDAVVVRSRTKVTKDVIDAAEKLKVIGRAGVGLDNIDVEYAKEKGVEVVNAPHSLTISVAELTLAHMLVLARHIHHADRTMRGGEWLKKKYVGVELYGKTVGVIGFGRIGREVADRCYALGMKVIAYDPFVTTEDAREHNAELVEFDELLKEADFVTIHVPLNDKTRGMIDKKKLELMKPTAFLVNTARGAVVKEPDLLEALRAERIRGAALDVYENEPLPEEHELQQLDNVVLTPHIGAGTEDAQITAGMVVVEKIRAILEG